MTKRKRDEFLFGRGCVAQHPLLDAPLLHGYDQKKKIYIFLFGGVCSTASPLGCTLTLGL